MMKLVRGIKGREKPTGVTFFSTWQDFEDEMSFIWNNARLYNEDESEVSQLAAELEVMDGLCVNDSMAILTRD